MGGGRGYLAIQADKPCLNFFMHMNTAIYYHSGWNNVSVWFHMTMITYRWVLNFTGGKSTSLKMAFSSLCLFEKKEEKKKPCFWNCIYREHSYLNDFVSYMYAYKFVKYLFSFVWLYTVAIFRIDFVSWSELERAVVIYNRDNASVQRTVAVGEFLAQGTVSWRSSWHHMRIELCVMLNINNSIERTKQGKKRRKPPVSFSSYSLWTPHVIMNLIHRWMSFCTTLFSGTVCWVHTSDFSSCDQSWRLQCGWRGETKRSCCCCCCCCCCLLVQTDALWSLLVSWR